jgi:hypothetical protein
MCVFRLLQFYRTPELSLGFLFIALARSLAGKHTGRKGGKQGKYDTPGAKKSRLLQFVDFRTPELVFPLGFWVSITFY